MAATAGRAADDPAGMIHPTGGPGRLPGTARSDALKRIAADISGRVDLDTLFEDVIDDAFTLFDVHEAGLWLFDGSEHPLSLAAQRGLSAEVLHHVQTIRRDARTAGLRAIEERRVVVLGGSLEGTLPELREVYRRAGIRTICFIPIVFRDEPLGLLVLYHHRPYDWSADERSLVRSFADGMAVALGNARLYESVQAHAARLDAIQDLTLRLSRVQDSAAIGEAIVSGVEALLAFDTVRVYLVDQETRMCEPIAVRGTFLGADAPTFDLLRIPIGTGLTGWVAEHNEPVRVSDAEHDPRGLVLGVADQPESILIVPMSYEDVVRGVIVVSQVGLDRFTTDDERTMSIFAGHAAQALVNVRQFEQVRRQQAALERQIEGQRRLLEVNERLLATLDPAGVLEMIADSLKSVAAYDSLTIYRVDRARGVRRAVVARDRFAELILEYEGPIDAGLTGWVIANREAVLANDAHIDPRSIQIPGTPFEPESMIIVPLRVGGEVVGTLNIGRMGGPEAHFTEHEFELTKLFAGQASLALQNAEAHGAVRVRADQDALTGLRNHGVFQRELGEAIAASGTEPLALLMMDLDGFKAYNDHLGHPAGDGLLVEVADAMRDAVRTNDALYRYGGDEFAVILRGADRRIAYQVGRRIRRAVAALGAGTDGPRVAMSVGVACLPADGRAKDDLVSVADRALYLAKTAARRTAPAR